MRASRAAALIVTVSAVVLAAVPAPLAQAASGPDWQPCDQPGLSSGGFECATLEVPLDRDDPGAGTVQLALARHRATGTAAQRIGSLVFNPGGPGGSGLDTLPFVWPLLPDSVRDRFDVVTWDPRGVGATRPALRGCAMPFPERPLTGPVDWSRVVREFARSMTRANRECQQRNAALVPHMGTNEVVADLDRIRVAIGDDQLTYWGMSYGTRIGYVYALRHPDRVRAMVLDGSIDPASTLLGLSEGGAAPDQAFGSFADAYPAADAQWRDLQRILGEGTVALPGGQVLDRWVLADYLYSFVAQQRSYPDIAGFVGLAHDVVTRGVAAVPEAADDLAAAVASVRALPNSNAGGVFAVVNCLDYPGRPSLSRQVAAVREQVRLGPDYGGSLATMFATNCSGFSFDPDPIPLITGSGSDVPALILGASRDGSTIVQWTARMSRAFPESRTVTYAGGQHVTWLFAGSECVDRVATRYVLTERLPAMDRGCPNTVVPEN
jgi:pimeloyl-ACP methyl ester carboxylesterase